MAIYYVRPDGNDSNTGLGSTTALAWRTVQKAVGATGISSGDTVYIAPGTYNEQIVVGGTYSATTSIIGDTTASQFTGINAGPVRFTPYAASGTLAPSFTGPVFSATSKNNLSIDSIIFQFQHTNTTNGVQFLTCQNTTLTSCVFETFTYIGQNLGCSLRFTAPSSLPANMTIQRCIFGPQASFHIYATGSSVADATIISDCLFLASQPDSITHANLQLSVYNSVFVRIQGAAIFQSGGSATNVLTIRNCLFYMCATGVYSTSTSTSSDNFNRYIGCNANATNATLGASTTVVGVAGIDYGQEYLVGLNPQAYFGAYSTSPNLGTGTASGAPSTDIFKKSWYTGQRDIGAATYNALSSVGNYLPTERNASTITIAPGSTSQSIELYLGATGLTASTSGLSARYNRTRTASVSIPLVARTIAQAWTSGGFAEVDATNMPGVYRVDIPDAALAAGADDVTVVVRGASGTNGAVMTIKLSSGGLTSAQTASAVWGASPAGYGDATTFGGVVNQIDATVTGTSVLVQDVPSNVWQEQTDDHTTHGTFGYNILRADAPSKEGLVTLHQSGGISRVDADIHAIVNDTAAAAELKGALLHNGTDYISADLLSPVTSAQTVRIGPFAVRTDAGGADGALDLNQSTAGAVVVQLTDAQGTGIDQTSATVQAKVYNVAGGLVATYTCTPAYAVNGFVSIPMTTAVTGTAGSYIINLWSTVGSTVIIYGPLQLRVRAI